MSQPRPLTDRAALMRQRDRAFRQGPAMFLHEEALFELQEELGIDTWQSCLAPLTFASHSYDDFHLLMPLFACRKWEGIPSPQEGQTLEWARPNALRNYEMPPADIPLISILRDWL